MGPSPVSASVAVLLCLSSLILGVFGATQPKNVTIDDYYGDPVTGAQVVYGPETLFWNIGQNCTGCTAKPDPSECYENTWHDGTFYPVGYTGPEGANSNLGTIMWANVSFTGTAVYVYTVLAHTSSGPDGASDMSFFVDGNKLGAFAQQPDNSTEYTYNALVFSSDALSAQAHELSIQIGYLNYKSLLMLDYIIYTSQVEIADPPSSSPTSQTGTAGSGTGSGSGSTINSSGSHTGTAGAISPTGSSTSGASSSTTGAGTNTNSATSTTSSAGGSDVSPAPDSDTTTPVPSHKSNTGAIVGGVVGGVAVIAITAALLLWLRRRPDSFSLRRMSIDGPSSQPAAPPGSLGRGAAFVGGQATAAGYGSTNGRPQPPPMTTRPSAAPLMQYDGGFYSDQSAASSPGGGLNSRAAREAAVAAGAMGVGAATVYAAHHQSPSPEQYSPPVSVDPPSTAPTSNPTHSRSNSGPSDSEPSNVSTNPNEVVLQERVQALEALVMQMHHNGASAAVNARGADLHRGLSTMSSAPPDYFSTSDSGGESAAGGMSVSTGSGVAEVDRVPSRRIVVSEKGRPMIVR